MSNHRLWPDSGQILRHQYRISVTELQTFLFAKRTPAAMSEEKHLFSKAFKGLATKHRASEQALQSALVVGWEKEGELATTSLEFEYLHWKSQCKILIGRDDISNDVYPWRVLPCVFQCLFTFVLISPSHWLAEIWQLSRRGNWRQNSNSRDVVASSPSFSRLTTRAPRRACSQATKHTNKQFATLHFQ